jgi:formylglycine-generating enzyme required for sulfatase activity
MEKLKQYWTAEALEKDLLLGNIWEWCQDD